MISIGKSLTAYPIFRLTLFMAAGIFLFGTYLHDVAAGRLVALLWLLSLCPVLVLSFLRHHGRPVLYGLFLSFSAFLFGGTVVLLQYERTRYSWPARECVYEGVVHTLPEEKRQTYAVEVGVRSVHCSGGDTLLSSSVHRNIILYLRKDSFSAGLTRGETVRFRSVISSPGADASRHGFHYGLYLIRRGISGTAYVASGKWERLPVAAAPHVRLRALNLRDRLSERFRSMGLAPDALAVLSALVIGDKRELTPEIKSVYTASGVSHILALSGMHVGIITLILSAFLVPFVRLPHGRSVRSLLVGVLLWGFAFVTGLSASVVRAVSMFTLYVLAALVAGEKYQSYNALTLTAFLMLVFCPFHLFDIGFQLSFAAVFSIILFYPLFRDLFFLRNPAVRYVWDVMSLSLSAQLGTLPLVLYHFGAFPTYFLVSNIIVAPLAFAILLLAPFALFLLAVPVVGAALSSVLNALLLLLNSSMSRIHGLYGAQLSFVHFSALQVLFSYLLILSIWLYVSHRSARRLQLSLCSFIIFLFSALL